MCQCNIVGCVGEESILSRVERVGRRSSTLYGQLREQSGSIDVGTRPRLVLCQVVIRRWRVGRDNSNDSGGDSRVAGGELDHKVQTGSIVGSRVKREEEMGASCQSFTRRGETSIDKEGDITRGCTRERIARLERGTKDLELGQDTPSAKIRRTNAAY